MSTPDVSLKISSSTVHIGGYIDPQPLLTAGSSWTKWAGLALSTAILCAAAYQLRGLNISELVALLPASPAFWVAFLAYYLAGPVSEWIIFRRLWHLPIDGFPALFRKLVGNEILLGYIGEVYFYAWARRHAAITTAPFGAIKDVAVLSAIAGNAVTLVMVGIAAPLFVSLHLGMDETAFAVSAIFVLLTSLAALLFRGRLFTLPQLELRFVTGIHLARILATTLLAATMWHLLLPSVALSWWLLLATFRQLLSRLPFLPNKDIVFAGLAVFLVGRDTEIVAAMTLMATLILAAHLIVGGALGAAGLAGEGNR